jgi:hypothetical protein
MESTMVGSDNAPSWLTEPSEAELSSNRQSNGVGKYISVDDDDDGNSVGSARGRRDRSSTGGRYSAGRGRGERGRSYGGYRSDDEELERGEDCCCCPLDPVLIGMSAFHGVCGLLGIAGVAVNAHHILSPEEKGKYLDIILRGYSLCFCFVIIVCEIDWRFLMRRFRILDIWLCRGFFYVYAGLQTLDHHFELTENALELGGTFNNLVGVLICISGVFYLLMGFCCIKSVAESKRRREAEKYREIDGADVQIESV